MRKEFEKLPEIARLIEKRNMIFNEEIGRYGALGYADHLSLIDDISFVSGAWYAWQAKAQVVPKGFVLVSKNKLKMELCSIRDLNNGEHSNSIIEDCVCNVEAMIEAQEQNQ